MRVLSLALTLLLASSCTLGGVGDPDAPAETVPAVRVGWGPDAESRLLAGTLAAMLRLAELPAEVVRYADARDARRALEDGRIDVLPAYTGEAWLQVLGRADPPAAPEASFAAVRAHDAERGIVWLAPRFGSGLDEPPADATFALVVPRAARDAGVQTVSQLAARLSDDPEAVLCVDRDFAVRADGLRAVLSAYSVRSDQPVLAADPEDAAAGVVAGDCVAGLTTATDAAAWSLGARPLEDDLAVFPAFVVSAQLREATVEARPEVEDALAPFAGELTTALLGRWNARVLAGEPVAEVVRDAAVTLLERAGREVDAPER